MFTTCLYCAGSLGSNSILESLPVGRRIAFDEARGRLWSVCRWCGKWNLVPFETRLEAIDDCARRFRATTHRFSTDNIGLAHLEEGLDLIRIGAALRPEFAAWRYGYRFAPREQRYALPLVGPLLRQFANLGVRTASPRLRDPWTDKVVEVPWFKLGDCALTTRDWIEWRLEVPYRNTDGFRGEEEPVLASIRDVPSLGLFSGPQIFPTLGRLLPVLQRRSASGSQIEGALAVLEKTRSPEGLFEYVAGRRLKYATQREFALRDVSLEVRLALEMAAHEETEQRAMEGELRLLERDWKAAEAVAAIADGLAIEQARA